MKTALIKTTVILGITALAAGLLALAGTAQKTDWKGKVLTEDGVRVVVNPAEPIYGQIKLDLGEELRIGKEGDEQSQFFRVRDVGADARGNIYVLDTRNFRVQVFDPSGKYLRTIGRNGQGPGEFEMPSILRLGGNPGNIYVLDRFRRVSLFDAQGIYLRSVSIDGATTFFEPAAGTGVYALINTGSDEDLTSYHALCLVSGEGKTQKILAQFPYTIHMERRDGATFSVSTGMELALHFAKLDDASLVYGYSKNYELVVIDPDGKKLLVIRKDGPRPEFSAAEKVEFGGFAVPEFRPYFFGLLTDTDGRIYVHRNTSTKIKRNYGPVGTEDKQVDVFSREGRFLFRTALPPNTRLIKGDLIYTYVVDEDQGLEYVQRFRIKNYTALPKN
jgi:hypothetical protein